MKDLMISDKKKMSPIKTKVVRKGGQKGGQTGGQTGDLTTETTTETICVLIKPIERLENY